MGYGGDKIQGVSFHLNDDFEITYGKDGKTLKIPRVSFKKGELVVKSLAMFLAKDTSGIFKIMDNLIKSGYGNVNIPETANSSIDVIVQGLVAQLVTQKMYGVIVEMLPIISEGIVTPEIIEEMQFSEAVGLLKYLLDENTLPLKNLYASLGQITMSGK